LSTYIKADLPLTMTLVEVSPAVVRVSPIIDYVAYTGFNSFEEIAMILFIIFSENVFKAPSN
jgi:hypothetical protein